MMIGRCIETGANEKGKWGVIEIPNPQYTSQTQYVKVPGTYIIGLEYSLEVMMLPEPEHYDEFGKVDKEGIPL